MRYERITGTSNVEAGDAIQNAIVALEVKCAVPITAGPKYKNSFGCIATSGTV